MKADIRSTQKEKRALKDWPTLISDCFPHFNRTAYYVKQQRNADSENRVTVQNPDSFSKVKLANLLRDTGRKEHKLL